MPQAVPSTEPRSPEALRRHYDVERALADRLRRAPRDQRLRLYSEVYDEFFERVPDLPKLADDPEAQNRVVELQARALTPFAHPDATFLEIGAGNGALALRMAGEVARVYAIEASAGAVAGLVPPKNFELLLSDSIPLPLETDSVDLAYSCHFLEHLHPEDAFEHVCEARRVLRPGGAYLCVTPNRLWGPHDISRYFDDVPTGFHLREYTHSSLARLFRRAAFRRAHVLRGPEETEKTGEPAGHKSPWLARTWPYDLFEGPLTLLPGAWRRRLLELCFREAEPPFRPLEQVKVVGIA